MQAEGLRSDLRRQVVQVQRLQESGKAQGQRQEAALKQARQEVLEAVQQGNHKYAAMLAERLTLEDELKHQLASKQQAASARFPITWPCCCHNMLAMLGLGWGWRLRVVCSSAARHTGQCWLNRPQLKHDPLKDNRLPLTATP